MSASPSPSPPSAASRTGFISRGGLWVVVQWILMAAVLAAAPLSPGHGQGAWALPLAFLLLAGGSWFGIAGAVALGKARTIYPEPKPDSRLIRHGIYGHVRHPLYTSMILLFLAWAIGWQSLPALGLALGATGFLDAKARHEEGRLRQRFPDYDDYARTVKRLFPGIY